jgi:hypothetical protein
MVNLFFVGILKATDEKSMSRIRNPMYGSKDTDPRTRIRLKMSRIRNIAIYSTGYFFRAILCMLMQYCTTKNGSFSVDTEQNEADSVFEHGTRSITRHGRNLKCTIKTVRYRYLLVVWMGAYEVPNPVGVGHKLARGALGQQLPVVTAQ